MNLGEILTRARQLLYETQGEPAAQDPFTLVELAVQVTDEISRRTYCLYLEGVCDIVSATALYCLPASFYKIRTVQELNSASAWLNLQVETTQVLNRQRGAWWQSTTPSDPATIAVINSPGFGVQLVPAPSVSRTAALKITGQYKPGYVWGFDATGGPLSVKDANGLPDYTVENPLPLWAQDAVPWGVATQRCMQFPTESNRLRFNYLQEQYERRIGEIHGAISTFSPPARIGCYYGAGAWGRW